MHGLWKPIEVIYLPVENGGDNGGFNDEGNGFSSSPKEMGRDGDYLQLAEDGSFSFQETDLQKGSWSFEKEILLLNSDQCESQWTLLDNLLVKSELDEEHGRKLQVLYQRETTKPAEKLSRKVEKEIQRFWDIICESDYVEGKRLKSIVEHGAVVLDKLQSLYILDACIDRNNYTEATILLELGYDPNFFEYDNPLTEVRSRSGVKAKRLVKLLLEKGADESAVGQGS